LKFYFILLFAAISIFCRMHILGMLQAYASTGEMYGYGSRASALGNTILGGSTESFATFYNPAANSSRSGLNISLGVSYAHPRFISINNVTIANSAVASDTGDRLGPVDTTAYLDHLGQALGISFNLGEKLKNLSLGVTGFLPVMRLAYLDTGEPFLPEYFNYRSRTQRPQIYTSLSATPVKDFHVASGIAFSTNIASTAALTPSAAARSVSHARFSTTIKPGAAPYFSAFFKKTTFEAASTIRLPNRYRISIDTNANARVLGTAGDLPVVVNLSSALYYDPFEVDLGFGINLTGGARFIMEADWLNYKAYESPSLTVIDRGSVAKFQNSVNNLPQMRNIIVPKVGYEQSIGMITSRLGYFFRQSPIKSNSGPGNLVDPTKHVFTAGLGTDLKTLKLTDKSIALDLHFQYHWLVKQRVNKDPGNEAGTAEQTKVGAPGYDIGGNIYGGGFSLSANF